MLKWRHRRAAQTRVAACVDGSSFAVCVDGRPALLSRAHQRLKFAGLCRLGSWHLHRLQRRVEALSDEDGGARHAHSGTLELALEEGRTGLNHVDLVQAQGIDPFLHVVGRRGAQQHWLRDARLAENDVEAVWLASFLPDRTELD